MAGAWRRSTGGTFHTQNMIGIDPDTWKVDAVVDADVMTFMAETGGKPTIRSVARFKSFIRALAMEEAAKLVESAHEKLPGFLTQAMIAEAIRALANPERTK